MSKKVTVAPALQQKKAKVITVKKIIIPKKELTLAPVLKVKQKAKA